MEPLTKEQIANIFQQIDKDHDGYITKTDLEATDYALSLFQNHPTPMNSFNILSQGKMNVTNFTMLVHAARYNLYPAVMMKFGMEKGLAKFLQAGAPAGAPPNIKQSYWKFKAHNQEGKENPHWFELELGVDKDQQMLKIKEVTTAINHAPHQVFLMVKIKTQQNGTAVAEKLEGLANTLLELAMGVAEQFTELLKGVKIYSKAGSGYVYLIVQVDNPLLDTFIQFIHNIFEAVSPNAALKGKFKVSSNLTNVLTENFSYAKTSGEVSLQVDVDHYTLKKIKDAIADYQPSQETQMRKIMWLLFEQIKLEGEFSNLGEALSSALQIDAEQLPKPNNFTSQIKQIGIKQMAEQFSDGGSDLFSLLKDNCQAQGQISINLHDMFFKLSFDMKQIKDIFELLG